jgi:hypothetical protein
MDVGWNGDSDLDAILANLKDAILATLKKVIET